MWIVCAILLGVVVGHGVITDVYKEYDALIGLTPRQLRDLYHANIVIPRKWALATAYKRHTLCTAIKDRLADMGEKL